MVFPSPSSSGAQLALDTILQRSTRGIPSWLLNIMEHRVIETLANVSAGNYRKDPDAVYLAMQCNIGTCLLDQYLADNPLTMGDHGFDPGTQRQATTGAEQIMLDGIFINSPEAVVEHLEKFEFPRIQQTILAFDTEMRTHEIIQGEIELQEKLGTTMLKSGYGFISFPVLDYYKYGYTNYFSAFGLFPEVLERHFSLQADLATLNNQAAAIAYHTAALPPLYRLDHDMADSRGTLVSLKSLDRLWFPQFARCLEPLLETDVRLIWHCDGNLMGMVPRLLDCGMRGFQGFQYEDGMDYQKICQLKDRQGRDLLIIAGVSVTRTLPFGSPEDVRNELRWLVENGPLTGLILGASSSITPGTPWVNIQSLVEGLKYYQKFNRQI